MRNLLRRAVHTALPILVVLLAAAEAEAQEPAISGFSTGAAAGQRALEARAIERIQPAALDSLARALAREPHVAGSAAQARVRDWILEQKRSWGLEAEVKTYSIYLPWPTAVELELVAPARQRFELGEPALDSDPTSSLPQFPWVNGYSGAGAVEGEVVYVNYGLHEDYARLDSIGVSVAGKIVLARYGRSYRGVKARLAEQQGALGLILYSDPYDDGYFRGDVYPDGAYRSPHAVQRGSIKNGPGDPSTPSWASVPGARRVEPGSTPGMEVPRIPVIPVGYAVAEPILRALRGRDLPGQEWQGALPLRYHVGPGPARVRLKVADDRETNPYKHIWNTIAWVRGRERPDEWVVAGAHSDAWNAGAGDNVSGTASVLAAARAVAELARAGARPRRTIVFATWDAEEWGLMGSTEWVEELAAELGARAVAYLNQDGVASGPTFGASAAPSLKRLVREASRAVPAPEGEGSLYEGWRMAARRPGPATPTPDVPEDPRTSEGDDVVLGNLGGGSDFAPFYNHLGIPSAGWGFGGGGSQYHSAYDTYAWMARFGDPGFHRHAASSRLVAVAALRLANAEVLPYDYEEFARELRAVVTTLSDEATKGGLADVGLADLDSAFAAMERGARQLAATRDAWLRQPAGLVKAARAVADKANQHLLQVERALTRPEGLRGRPWYRNLIFASDWRNYYATIALPSVAEAIRERDAALARSEAEDLARRVRSATMHIGAATAVLRGTGTS